MYTYWSYTCKIKNLKKTKPDSSSLKKLVCYVQISGDSNEGFRQKSSIKSRMNTANTALPDTIGCKSQ